MESRFFFFFALVQVYFIDVISLTRFGHAIAQPSYTVVHSESDYEIRLYQQISWVSAPVRETSFQFQKSTEEGFHRIYQYIHGSNLNSSQIPMTAPVVTSIIQSSQGYVYDVRLFTNEEGLPHPNPELNLQLDQWRSRCLAVRQFSGFAKDDNINGEMEALVASLKKHSPVLKHDNSYSIAQYNASYHHTGRVNEVWMDVSGFSTEGCPPRSK